MLEITPITLQQVLPLRSRMLRNNTPADACVFDCDHLPSVVHLGVWMNHQLSGVATFFEKHHPLFSEQSVWQLRGMATDSAVQRLGLGRQLLQAGVMYIEKQHGELLWCNARTSAQAFYQKQGFTEIGEAFDVPGIGEHRVMYRRLLPN